MGNIKNIAETSKNRFANSPLGRQPAYHNLVSDDNNEDISLAEYVGDVLEELYEDGSHVCATHKQGKIIRCAANAAQSPDPDRDLDV